MKFYVLGDNRNFNILILKGIYDISVGSKIFVLFEDLSEEEFYVDSIYYKKFGLLNYCEINNSQYNSRSKLIYYFAKLYGKINNNDDVTVLVIYKI
jgi:hypothetical protein